MTGAQRVDKPGRQPWCGDPDHCDPPCMADHPETGEACGRFWGHALAPLDPDDADHIDRHGNRWRSPKT